MTAAPGPQQPDEVLAATCPSCAQPGTLRLTERLVATPLGTWSLAGVQTKTAAKAWPALECTHCAFVEFARIDGHKPAAPSAQPDGCGHPNHGGPGHDCAPFRTPPSPSATPRRDDGERQHRGR